MKASKFGRRFAGVYVCCPIVALTEPFPGKNTGENLVEKVPWLFLIKWGWDFGVQLSSEDIKVTIFYGN